MSWLSLILSFLIVLPVAPGIASAENPLKPIDTRSKVKFTIKNFGISVGGSFKGLAGIIQFDPGDLNKSQFDVSVDASTLNTGIGARDSHLKGKDYFDINNHPRIRFRSASVHQGKKNGSYLIKGNLTIKSITKEIIFPFDVIAQEGGYLFTGTFTLDRNDFDLGGRSISLSDILTVSLQVLTKE